MVKRTSDEVKATIEDMFRETGCVTTTSKEVNVPRPTARYHTRALRGKPDSTLPYRDLLARNEGHRNYYELQRTQARKRQVRPENVLLSGLIGVMMPQIEKSGYKIAKELDVTKPAFYGWRDGWSIPGPEILTALLDQIESTFKSMDEMMRSDILRQEVMVRRPEYDTVMHHFRNPSPKNSPASYEHCKR